MRPIGRLWILAGLNAATTVLVPLFDLGAGGAPGVDGQAQAWILVLVYTNVTAIPALLEGPSMAEWLTRRNWPPTAAVLASTIIFAALGCLAAQTLLMWAGIAVPAEFWRQYLHTLRTALLFSMVFGLGVFSYASMRDQLRRAREQLHEQALVAERNQKLAVEARLRSLESRLHPHFLFNTLNSISALIAVDPPRAERIVGRLATLLRSSLDTTGRPLIPLEQELAIVQDYMDIERARFGDRLRGRIDVPAELRDAQVPPLSVQSLVENAVKHGITPRREGGEVCVSATAASDCVRIEVSDTGAGFDLSSVCAGHGLDSLVGRLDTLFGSRAHLAVSRREDRCVVQMVLPRS